MGLRVLMVSLVPREVLARAVAELRRRHPEAEVTALLGTAGVEGGHAGVEADEILDWHAATRGRLLAEVRERRFDLMLLIHGRDQYASRTYWKAVGLAIGSRARRKAFWEDGRPADRGLPGAALLGALRAGVQVVEEAYVAGMGVAVLAPVLIAVAVTDLSEALAGKRGAGPPVKRGKDRG